MTVDDREELPARQRKLPRGLVLSLIVAGFLAVVLVTIAVERHDSGSPMGSLKIYEGTVGFAQAAQPAHDAFGGNPAGFGLVYGPHDTKQVSGVLAVDQNVMPLPQRGDKVRAVLWTPAHGTSGQTTWVQVTTAP